jgi:hypothetical protein
LGYFRAIEQFHRPLWRQALELAPVGVNQVEFRPFLEQELLARFARERNLHLVDPGWAPDWSAR